MKATTLRLSALAAAAVTALGVATTATAARPTADRSLDRSAPGPATAGVAAGVRAARSAAAARPATSRLLGPAANLAAGEHPGFAWCGDDVAYVWPGQVATTHDYTLYRTYFISSANGTFSDAQVTASDFYGVQVGLDYYIYDTVTSTVSYGPTHFGDAWLDYSMPGNTDTILFYQQIVNVDGGVAGTPEYVQLEALGPSEVGGSNACRP